MWLFGAARVEHDAHRGEVVLPRSVEALLAYLVLRRNRLRLRHLEALAWRGRLVELGQPVRLAWLVELGRRDPCP